MKEQTDYLERALADGHAKLLSKGKTQQIIYIAANHSERFDDPEERVRAEYWAELIYRYEYEPRKIGIEVIVPDRTPKDVADLVVFKDDGHTIPYAVIECKRDDISDAEFSQAVEQVCGNGTWSKLRASYVGVIAGTTRRFLDFSDEYGVLEREQNIIADLPIRYGRPEEFKYHRNGALDIKSVKREELISVIKKCHQTLWGGGRLSPPAAFGELCKIIFVKISDEKAPRKTGEPYSFQIKTHEPSRKLAERIKALYEKEKKRDPDVFTETIKIDDATLRTVVSHLEGINLDTTDLDVKGIAFEQFMDGFFKGDFGQYFTPRPIIEFAVQMLKPTRDDYVLDPACGSGGFLLYALDFIRHEADDYYEPGTKDHLRHWQSFARNHLFGIEINEEITRVAKMNMILHEDGHGNVIGMDALNRIERASEVNKGFSKERFDLVLTNPPFGADVKATIQTYLSDYELGHSKTSTGKKRLRKSQKTEILFIERIWHYLKPGTGRTAVVLPDGVLTNSTLQYVRDFILERFQLLAVISFPKSVFQHYGAGVKASIVFLRKRGDEEPDDNEMVFMASPEFIGFDTTGKECTNQLPEIVNEYEAFKSAPESFLT